MGEMWLRRAAGSAHTTAVNKGTEDLHPCQRQLREDGVRRLPPSPMATMSTLHLLPSRSGRDPAGSVTTSEERYQSGLCRLVLIWRG